MYSDKVLDATLLLILTIICSFELVVSGRDRRDWFPLQVALGVAHRQAAAAQTQPAGALCKPLSRDLSLRGGATAALTLKLPVHYCC